jgi:hypothetical protein
MVAKSDGFLATTGTQSLWARFKLAILDGLAARLADVESFVES